MTPIFSFNLFKSIKDAMRKIVFITTTLVCLMLLFSIFTSCNQLSGKKEGNESNSMNEAISEQEIPSAEKWLKSIFECEDGNGYCLPADRDVFTDRYNKFFLESLEIFEYPDFKTEKDRVSAEDVYRKKWKDIYPLGKEIWTPFGQGNGMEAGDKLENVTIISISDLEYTVLVDYGEGSVFSNDVLLVLSGDAYLIDYIETELIE